MQGEELALPGRTARLLYFSDNDPEMAVFGFRMEMTIDLFGGPVRTKNLPPDDPSTIFTRMPIRRPPDVGVVPRPDYYPTYAGLTEEQKWIYLNWLRSVKEPVNIGYVFIYYYGLERHLLRGEFDLAFDEILLLRRHHDNRSFQWYSASALVYSCIIRRRPDRLANLNETGELADLANAEILLAYSLGGGLSAQGLMAISRKVPGVNRRYMASEASRYQSALGDVLRERYGQESFPIASRYELDDLPRKKGLTFANISFPPEVRSPALPSFLHYEPFQTEVRDVCQRAHETVKAELKEARKQASGQTTAAMGRARV